MAVVSPTELQGTSLIRAAAFQLVVKYLPHYPEVSEADILAAVEDSMFAVNTFRNGVGAAAAELDDEAHG